jgi:hypothetical protein
MPTVGDLHGLTGGHSAQDGARIATQITNPNSLHVRHCSTTPTAIPRQCHPDLSIEYRFLEIAQVCLDNGRDDQALEWAEHGVRAFPPATDKM